MTVSTKAPVIAYIIPLVIVYLTVAQLRLLTPFISVAILYVIVLGVLFFIDRKIITYKFFPWWICFSAIVILNTLSGDSYYSDIIVVLSTFFFIAFSAITANYCNNIKDDRLIQFLLVTFFISVVYLTICSVIIDIREPGALRNATAMGFQGDNRMLLILQLDGMSNYYLPHALPMLIPPLIMGIKNRELSFKVHVILYIILASVLALIYVSYATTPLLFALLFLILSIFVKQGSIKNNIGTFIIVTIIFLPLILSNDLLLSILQSFDTITGGEGELHSKISMFQETITTGKASGDMEERFDLYNESAAFLQYNWFIGTNEEVGGHSFFMDSLSTLGIIGFIPLVFLLYKQIKYSQRFLPKSSHIYYFFSILAGLLMFLIKSMNNWEMWLVLFCIVPLLTLKLSKTK